MMKDRKDTSIVFRTKEPIKDMLRSQADAANRSMAQQLEFLILQEQKRLDKEKVE
jgi:hypothetical protein